MKRGMLIHDREAIRGMERLTFALTDRQLIWLSQEAKRLQISLGELLRRIIDEYQQEHMKAIT